MEAGIHKDVGKIILRWRSGSQAARESDAFRNSATSVSTHSVGRLPGSGE
jgi:hypothetical protein